MKKPKLSSDLSEDLKKHSQSDRKRRIITNVTLGFLALAVIVAAKLFIFKGDIKMSGQEQKSPSQKIENQPVVKDTPKNQETTTTKAATAQPAPTTTTTAPPAPSQGFTTYVVKNGDTLSQIANANGMTSKQLADYNGMSDADSLQPGQTIKIPK